MSFTNCLTKQWEAVSVNLELLNVHVVCPPLHLKHFLTNSTATCSSICIHDQFLK